MKSLFACALLNAALLVGCVPNATNFPTVGYPSQGASTGSIFSNGDARVEVRANAEQWRDSGVFVKAGQKYKIEAEGMWGMAKGDRTGPDGTGGGALWRFYKSTLLLPGYKPSTLLAKIGESGSPFVVGSYYELTADSDGKLTFRSNLAYGQAGWGEGVVYVKVTPVDKIHAPETLHMLDTQPPIRSSSLWAVVIGISEYQYEGPGGLGRLSFADNDAEGFAKALQTQGWNPDHIRLLLNREATKRNVENALETWLRRATKDDLVVLYWSSHGWPDLEDAEKAYFACHDSRPSDPSSGFRMDKVRMALEERGVRNVVVIADTCHSGKMIRANDPKGVGIVPALEAMQKRQEIPKGWVFVASADSDRKAYEDRAWKNGALTHVLLEGLRGSADGYKSAGPKDDVVTLGELRAYTTDRMAEESLNVLGARLLPLFYTTSGSPEIWDLTLKSNGERITHE